MLDKNMEFKKIYDEYSNTLYKICLSVLNDKHLALDALNEVFIKIYKNLAKIDKHPNVSGYLYLIARNTSIDFYRKERKTRENTTEYLDYNKQADETTEDIFLKKRIRISLNKGIEKLNEKEQKAILLYYQEDKSLSEIAGTLGISYNTVKMMLLRARKKLKDYIDKEVG